MKLPVNRIEDGNGYVTTTSMMRVKKIII